MWEARLVDLVKHTLAHEATGHDLAHSIRVRNLAERIALAEGGDIVVLVATAYLHDLFRGDSENTNKSKTIGFARTALSQISFPADRVPDVVDCIRYHSWSERHSHPPDLSRNVLIFQDADRLDAMGAFGIARTFTYGGSIGRAIGIPHDARLPLDTLEAELETGNSTLDHFYSKLLLLEGSLSTGTAQQIAHDRHKYLESFLSRLTQEWNGEK